MPSPFPGMDPYLEDAIVFPDFHDGSVPKCDYHICCHRFDNLEDYFIYPIQLPQELPIIPIPLLPGDGEVSVSLQKVMQRTYAAGPYHREIDCSQSVPPPKLSDEQTEWVQKQLLSRR